MADRVMLADNKPIKDETIQRHLDECGFLFGQPKIDGMRVYHGKDHIPQSRSGKEWKNKPLRAWCQAHLSMVGIDGEVVPGHFYTADSFRDAMSGTRREDGSREFTFFVFDHVTYSVYPYWDRYRFADDYTIGAHGEFQEADQYHAKIVLCPTVKLYTLQDV